MKQPGSKQAVDRSKVSGKKRKLEFDVSLNTNAFWMIPPVEDLFETGSIETLNFKIRHQADVLLFWFGTI